MNLCDRMKASRKEWNGPRRRCRGWNICYRDDHVLFHNLTHAHGTMILHAEEVEVYLFPTAHYPLALRKIVEELFDRINADNPRMADGSHRRISVHLGDKTGIKLAKA